MNDITINSSLLLGITQDHEEHNGLAIMNSTGNMVLFNGDKSNAKNWCVEYLCEVCNAKILGWSADTNDIIRDVLKEKGILNADGLPADRLAAGDLDSDDLAA